MSKEAEVKPVVVKVKHGQKRRPSKRKRQAAQKLQQVTKIETVA